ncbi:MAG: hypothetical protein H6993_18440 [Pseudomonadales bacterium]|nr:hypothetical protein [Pseudomonadales bacterium]MCP5185951.1 hypothetical protein [Pseudomonadales bacterium]
MFENILRYRSARYFWWSLALVLVCVGIYVTHGRAEPPNGGTWQGYTLGTVGALLIVWLTWLGVRKRRYGGGVGSVQGWTSAHVYLGTACLVIGSLHSALQFGWNVHTLAYVLMCLVIFSGFFGLYVYVNYPRVLSDNRLGGNRESLFGELFELNERGLALARRCSVQVQQAVNSAIERTVVGGGVWAQLSGADHSRIETEPGKLIPHPDQQLAIDTIASLIPRSEKAQEVVALEELLSVLCRRQTILRRLRHDIRMQGWLQVWLYVHVPVTIALIGALIVHIVTTFFYW